MLIVPDNAPDIATLRAILFGVMAFPIVLAMAGGSHCCCDRPQSSTSTTPSSTSTSTSTGSTPPLPPRPPGSSSTSTGSPPLPPFGSTSTSTSGRPPENECPCCTSGVLVRAWQADVTGVGTDVCSPGPEQANGTYIVDPFAPGQTDSYYASCISGLQMTSCGFGGTDGPGSVFCPEERLFIGWIMHIIGVRGNPANTSVDVATVFWVRWRGIPPAFCGGHAIEFRQIWYSAAKSAFAPVLCTSIDPADLPDCETQVPSGTSLGAASGYPGSDCILSYAPGY